MQNGSISRVFQARRANAMGLTVAAIAFSMPAGGASSPERPNPVGGAARSAVCANGPSGGLLLGVIPFVPPQRLELTFAPMAARLGEALGCTVHFRTTSTYERYQDRLAAEAYDFAVVSPFTFIRLDPERYEPLARAPGTARAVFVVLEDSSFLNLADLRGKVLAFGPKEADASYLARFSLAREGFEPDRDFCIRYFNSFASCLQQVLAGTAAACATTQYSLEPFEERMKTRFRVVAESCEITQALVVAHRRVPQADRETVRNLLLTWRKDVRNHLHVGGAQVPTMVPVASGDYDSVREMWRVLHKR